MKNIFTKSYKTKTGKEVTYLSGWVTFILAMALSIGTWNPTKYNFIHYITSNIDHIFSGFIPFFILLMIALWLLAIKAMLQSLGFLGLSVALAVIGAFIWGLQQYNIIDVTNSKQLGWTATIVLGFIIWLGLNASIFWKKLTGVYTTDSTAEDIDG